MNTRSSNVEADYPSDDCSTVSTASSSCMEQHEITILSHYDDDWLRRDIHRILSNKGWNEYPAEPAGREWEKNWKSLLKHGKYVIILLTKKNCQSWQSCIDTLKIGQCQARSMLLLYESRMKQKKIGKNLRGLIRHPFNTEDLEKTAVTIERFVEANKIADSHNIVDDEEWKHFYASCLLAGVVKENGQMVFDELEKVFKQKYGAFEHMNVGGLKVFLESSKVLTSNKAGKMSVAETEMMKEWLYRVSPGYDSDHNKIFDEAKITNQDSLENENPSHSVHGLPKQPLLQEDWENSEIQASLKAHLGEFDARYGHFLVLSRLTGDNYESVEGLGRIPWLRVFDFDTESRKDGLLHAVEESIKKRRKFTISTICQESICKLSDLATDWLFMKGFSDKSETIFEGTASKWFRNNDKALETIILNQVQFCFCQKLPVFLVLWYDDQLDLKFLDRFLLMLSGKFARKNDKLPSKIVLCLPAAPAPESALEELINEHELQETTIIISLCSLSRCLSTFQLPPAPHQGGVKIPKHCEGEEISTACLEIEQVSWMNTYMELLPLRDDDFSPGISKPGEEFVKGETITWNELDMGTIAVVRNIEEDFYQYVKHGHVDKSVSKIIPIFHAPGGGGTTFARQILWKLHKIAPCCVVDNSFSMSLHELSECLKKLYHLSQLPVVLLVDGGSSDEVQRLFDNRTYAIIILHVQRCKQHHKKKSISEGDFYVDGFVTKQEAKRLRDLFSTFAPRSKAALCDLYSDVLKKKFSRQMFEFGLTAFDHKFKGARSFVKGYLEPQANDRPPWKMVVLYLSLLKYFGQTGLHREVFHSFLDTKEDFVSLNDLDSGKYFVVETSTLTWRLNYHAVAKDVLELMLTSGTSKCESSTLSPQAKALLHERVIDFIEFLGNVYENQANEKATKPLIEIILKRNYQDVDENDAMQRKTLSPLMECIVYDKRQLVLEKLVKAFPTVAEFHAHLGRYLSMIKKFEEAEISLQMAIDLRFSEGDTTSMHFDRQGARIHHMFGNSYSKRIQHEMNSDHLGSFEKQKILEKTFEVQENILKFAKQAIDNFVKGRRLSASSHSYGYIGEIKVRLLVVEFAEKVYGSCFEKALNNTLGKENAALAEFIRISHAICDQLFLECHNFVPEHELKKVNEYSTCISYFYEFFGQNVPAVYRGDQNSIPMRQGAIAAIKAQYFRYESSRTKSKLPTVDDVCRTSDVFKIIELHEKTMDEVFTNNIRFFNISANMLEWLDAIRRDTIKVEYHLPNVLNQLEKWHDRNEQGYSLFYMFVVTFMLGLSFPSDGMRKEYIARSKEYESQARSKYRSLGFQRGIREVLGCHDRGTIRKLVPNRKVEWDKDKKQFKHSHLVDVFTGTVTRSDNPLAGKISLDISVRGTSLTVYFVPTQYGLWDSRYAKQSTRVEFFIGFSIYHCAEALAVKPLEQRFCPKCRLKREVITLNQDPGYVMCSRCHESFADPNLSQQQF